MAKAFFNVLFKIIIKIIDIFLIPINALLVNFFPNLSTKILIFNRICETYILNTLGWFSHLLPPLTKEIIVVYLALLISYYTITVSVHLILKVIAIIKAIKLW